MKVTLDASSLRSTSWYQYALRFVLGGLVTVGAGLIAGLWGPVVGGLFLAFPAIFPAGATLIASRECKKKTQAGLECGRRGQRVAALDAAGAILGSVGLVGFAAWVWHEVTRSVLATFLGAPAFWGLISLGVMVVEKEAYLAQSSAGGAGWLTHRAALVKGSQGVRGGPASF